MTDIYLTKTFQAFAAHERISDATVIQAAREIQNQLYDANLGSCVLRNESPARVAVNAAVTGCLLPFEMRTGFFSCGDLPKMKWTTLAVMN